MKKATSKTYALLLLVGFIIALFILLQDKKPSTSTVYIGKHQFKVEIADTSEKRAKGLSGRKKLSSDSGMLFVFPKSEKYSFWMKDMRFPLDFIWINDGKVVDITPDVSPPSKDGAGNKLTWYAPKEPVNKVLEINAGQIQKLGIKIGDKTKFK